MDSFQSVIKEICDEKDIKFELLSKDWIIKLTKGEKTEYIVGMRFPINNYVSAMLCKDKYAMYNVLTDAKIPVVEYKLMYSYRISNYNSDLNNKEQIKKYLDEHGELVVKDNCGANGIDVYRAVKYSQIKKYLNKIYKMKDTAIICPFLNIEAEYRVICLNGNVELIFLKERNNGEWKHNLSHGAIPKIITDEILKKELGEFALKVANTIRINFASVDLIKVDGKLMVLEVNSSVCMNKFMEQVEYGRNIAKEIYSKVINEIF